MKTLELKNWNAKEEFELLYSIWKIYKKNPWSVIGLKIKTPSGIFINDGGFNGEPADLWFIKKGTTGSQKRTFWRTGIGSKKKGFCVFINDLRSVNVTNSNYNQIASEIGASVIKQDSIGLKYFTK